MCLATSSGERPGTLSYCWHIAAASACLGHFHGIASVGGQRSAPQWHATAMSACSSCILAGFASVRIARASIHLARMLAVPQTATLLHAPCPNPPFRTCKTIAAALHSQQPQPSIYHLRERSALSSLVHQPATLCRFAQCNGLCPLLPSAGCLPPRSAASSHGATPTTRVQSALTHYTRSHEPFIPMPHAG